MQLPQLNEVLNTGPFLLALASLIQLLAGAVLYPSLAWGVAEETLKRWAEDDPRAGMRAFLQRPPAPKALAEYSVFVVRASMILRSQGLAILSALATLIVLWREAHVMAYAQACFWATFIALSVAIISTVLFLWRLYRRHYDPLRRHSALGVYLLVLLANIILLAVGVVSRL
jgi:hypothetical protein